MGSNKYWRTVCHNRTEMMTPSDKHAAAPITAAIVSPRAIATPTRASAPKSIAATTSNTHATIVAVALTDSPTTRSRNRPVVLDCLRTRRPRYRDMALLCPRLEQKWAMPAPGPGCVSNKPTDPGAAKMFQNIQTLADLQVYHFK